MRRLVLWDIDGTLVQAGEVGRDIFTEAFQAVLGRDPDQVTAKALVMAGRTDPEIALEFLAAHEIAEGASHLPAFSEALVTALAAKAAVIRERGRALPGAREALVALGRTEGVVQSLLTGNLQPNALLKLASFELDGHLDFEVGGFGSDHHHRPSLVEVARAKAERKYGTRLPGDGHRAGRRHPPGRRRRPRRRGQGGRRRHRPLPGRRAPLDRGRRRARGPARHRGGPGRDPAASSGWPGPTWTPRPARWCRGPGRPSSP